MEQSDKKDQEKKKITEAKTFSVPFTLGENKENITITTNTSSNPSKEKIINQAFKFHSQGNILEAVKYYQLFINQGFTDHRVFSNYGIILNNLGKSKDAEVSTRKAIELNPGDAEAHYNLGIILKGIGKLQDAVLSYRKAIELNPALADAHSNLANILKDLGKLNEAEVAVRKAIELKPDDANAHLNLGGILKDLEKLKDAESSTRKAIELNPNFAEAHLNLGSILKDLSILNDAEVSTRKAIELNPDFAEAYLNLGGILKDLDKLKDAESSTRKAIELNPALADAHSNLGNILKDLGKLNEAEVAIRKTIKLQSDHADAYFMLSLIELLKENYQSGLENYEFRFTKNGAAIPHGVPKLKRINRIKLKKADKLLVVSEQGLGDTLQHMRYIPYLRNQGLEISFSAQTKLHSLIQASDIDQNPLTPKQSTLVSEGEWIPLLSLARDLEVSPENPIVTQPYICSTEELNKKWKNILSKEKRPIIGINWQGNLGTEKTYQGRSIPLEKFSILKDNNEITFLSLQKGFGSEQLNSCSFKNKFVDCQPQIDRTWDFLENAAIIENCDLIISCDTSIAHLAGGMGSKVWLLLKDIPFWTWGLEREDTFWYPSMKLFRQKERHNWNEVMERVSIALRSFEDVEPNLI
ncbi:tetratricopeptide repeat protein [Prochlorococcus marinus]|uniref:tetratricopeptide repeat protein n=1 Tax=Prochlorococcus marinus TaxID=1219 RepID=UPI0022B3FA56|nr:tetratricopeptide repeat protein [Prochlorococcus marinus]